MKAPRALLLLGLASGACSTSADAGDAALPLDAPRADAALADRATLPDERLPEASLLDALALDAPRADSAPDAPRADVVAPPPDAPPPPCTTRVYYGESWIAPPGHAARYDDVAGQLQWDGACRVDASGNSVATLSNGWQPYFAGRGRCALDLEYSAGCAGAPRACETRVSYGAAWLPPAGHPNHYDDVAGALLWDGACTASGGQSSALLSNGWTPTFSGAGGCELSFRYTQCGPLYQNPVVGVDCPDPGVLYDGARYVMACTSGGAPAAFPLRTSTDLVRWTDAGSIFPAGGRPTWASGDFWAPEIHRVGTRFVAYFTARNASDGRLCVGAATAPSATGPFTDLGHPLVHNASQGVIDPSEFEAPDGSRYLLWKVDGNATGQRTPLFAQPLAADGVTLQGSPTQLLTNDQAWEGAVVEGPWLYAHGGMYYLFYSGNAYDRSSYALGVARASNVLGPYTKMPGPLVASRGGWAGPGHGSVLTTPAGDTVFVYHAWEAGHVAAAPGRLVLVDRVFWSGGWPSLPQAPSLASLPYP